jgi:hypothetical protein
MRLIRVFPRRTRATPTDELAYFDAPDLFAQGDLVLEDRTPEHTESKELV